MAATLNSIYSYYDTLLDKWIEWNDSLLVGKFDHSASSLTEAVGASTSDDRSRAKEMYRIGLVNTELTLGNVALQRIINGHNVQSGLGFISALIYKASKVQESPIIKKSLSALCSIYTLLQPLIVEDKIVSINTLIQRLNELYPNSFGVDKMLWSRYLLSAAICECEENSSEIESIISPNTTSASIRILSKEKKTNAVKVHAIFNTADDVYQAIINGVSLVGIIKQKTPLFAIGQSDTGMPRGFYGSADYYFSGFLKTCFMLEKNCPSSSPFAPLYDENPATSRKTDAVRFLQELAETNVDFNKEFNKVMKSVIDGAKEALNIIDEANHPVSVEQYKDYLALLKKNLNLVLTGAPGTGKTFMSKQIAALLIGNCSWKELSESQRSQVEFVQFHPSYDYTDFVEGLRPDEKGEFNRADGSFKNFCRKAAEDKEKRPFVFIIDEINRGEISKIFGELFYSIEPDYRGEGTRVKTQYNNMVCDGDIFKKGFYVPENVYIIGTMNDIDRGVEAMDFAIRRRFAWREVTAAESAIRMGLTEDVTNVMEALNGALKLVGLNEAYSIGGAYFRKLEGDKYDDLWEYHLKGIVNEYFRGEPEAEQKMAKVAKAYKDACPKKEDQ